MWFTVTRKMVTHILKVGNTITNVTRRKKQTFFVETWKTDYIGNSQFPSHFGISVPFDELTTVIWSFSDPCTYVPHLIRQLSTAEPHLFWCVNTLAKVWRFSFLGKNRRQIGLRLRTVVQGSRINRKMESADSDLQVNPTDRAHIVALATAKGLTSEWETAASRDWCCDF
jgi:hypothetical protein